MYYLFQASNQKPIEFETRELEWCKGTTLLSTIVVIPRQIDIGIYVSR